MAKKKVKALRKTKKKKPVKRKTKAKVVRKKAKKPAGKAVKKTKVKKKSKSAVKVKSVVKKAPVINGTLIGKVTHYFPHVNAAVIKIDRGELRVGDTLYFKGHTSDFKQAVTSIQINRVAIERATVGDEIGIQVKDRVREGDDAYKMKTELG